MIVPVHLVDDVRAVRVVGAGVVVVNNVLASARVTAHWVALLLRGGVASDIIIIVVLAPGNIT
jgi:hypothetical protein